MGKCTVNVALRNKSAVSPLVITKGDTTNLLGRNWWFFNLGIQVNINSVHSNAKVLQELDEVFNEKLGIYVGPPVHLDLNNSVRPIALRPRQLAYTLKALVETELNRLIRKGVLTPIEPATWATPIVPVLKSDGHSVRLCADYKCTLNKALGKDAGYAGNSQWGQVLCKTGYGTGVLTADRKRGDR